VNALVRGDYSSEQLVILDESRLYFTVSLGEPLDNGYCFKPAAVVLELPTGWPRSIENRILSGLQGIP
jgi:hypothetical protein